MIDEITDNMVITNNRSYNLVMKNRMLNISLIALLTSLILFGCSFYAMNYMNEKVSVLESRIEENKTYENKYLDEAEQMKTDIEELIENNKEKVEEFALWQHQNEKLEEVLKPYR